MWRTWALLVESKFPVCKIVWWSYWSRTFPNNQQLHSWIYILQKHTFVQQDTHTRVLMAAIFRIAPNWKQPTYPSAAGCIVGESHNGILLHNNGNEGNEGTTALPNHMVNLTNTSVEWKKPQYIECESIDTEFKTGITNLYCLRIQTYWSSYNTRK